MRMSQRVAALLAFVGAAWAVQGRFKILGNLPEHRLGDFRRPDTADFRRPENRQVVLSTISRDFK